jgi:hypothetical protein
VTGGFDLTIRAKNGAPWCAAVRCAVWGALASFGNTDALRMGSIGRIRVKMLRRVRFCCAVGGALALFGNTDTLRMGSFVKKGGDGGWFRWMERRRELAAYFCGASE